MIYQNLVEDFARRTQENLRLLKEMNNQGVPVYEVTAIINSMLGLLVFPQQTYIDSIPEIPIDVLEIEGWPIPTVVGDFPQVQNLRQLVRHLRNAISHFNIQFTSDHSDQIVGLKVWNTDPRRSGQKTWVAELSVAQLEVIAQRFIALILREQ